MRGMRWSVPIHSATERIYVKMLLNGYIMLLSEVCLENCGLTTFPKKKNLVASKTCHTTLCELSHNAFPNPNIRDTTVGATLLGQERGFHISKLQN